MHELTLQTFWGTPLALLPSGILLTWVVHMRIATFVATGGRGRGRQSADERARLLRLASLAAGFSVAASALAAMTSGVCVIFRIEGQVPLLATQSLALLAMVVVAAALTVEGNAALRAREGGAQRGRVPPAPGTDPGALEHGDSSGDNTRE